MKRFWTILCLSVLILSSMIFIGCTNDQPTEPADKKLITLPAPTEVTSEGRMLSWKAVHHASEYIIQINNNEYHASETSYDLSSLTDPGTYEIKVKAVGDGVEYSDSEWTSYTYTAYEILETGTDELGFTYVLREDGKSYELDKGNELRGVVTIPDYFQGLPVTLIGGNAFKFESKNTSITGIIIPSTVEEIGGQAFIDLSRLRSVTIPDSVKTIGWNAFDGCAALSEINVSNDWDPDYLAEAFDSSTWYYNQPDGLVMLGKVVYKCKGTATGTVTIPNGTVAIARSAFAAQDKLTSVIIPNGVKLAGEQIFSNCYSLSRINLPSDLKSIPGYTFADCSSLSAIVIPDEVTEIGNLAFCAAGLETVVLPSGLNKVDARAFSSCSKLSEIYFAGTVERFNELMTVNNSDSMPTATVYAYSETQPTAAGNYWHYVNGVATAW